MSHPDASADTARWARIQALFEEALACPAADRAAFLEAAAPDDPTLRTEVAALLVADAAGHSLLDGGALRALEAGAEVAALESGHPPGHRVGPYRLVRRLGVGGMGEVYLAERAEGDFEQQVALKLIRGGLASETIRRRFLSERQILARLQHPNIARLYDGGLTEAGVPYFAMEYVEGEPIDRYCDRHRLSVDARLRLFTTVCKAVLYAHANLVVHRDLKPANILVTADGRVKLLDFGIARLLDDDPDLRLTQTGQRVLTPAYASPEQVHGDPTTTATDIYSLGVVLYELLTGRLPFPLDGLSGPEVERHIRTTEPERPSTAIGRATASPGPHPEAARGTTAERLRRRLAGDLDVICLTALRKEPERRYPSAEALGQDVERHLGGLPIRARRDTVGYRMRKFARRHRVGLTATAAVTLLLVASVVALALQQAETARERDRAQREARKAEAVAAFMQTLFEEAAPTSGQDRDVTARALLDVGAQRIARDLAEAPEVRAELLHTMGAAYASLGHFDDAQRALTASRDLRREAPGEQQALAATLLDLGDALIEGGKYEEAEATLREALRLRRAAPVPDPAEVARVLTELGGLFTHLPARYDEGEVVLREALDVWATVDAGDDPDRASTLILLGAIVRSQGDDAQAEALLQEALALRRRLLGSDHVAVANALNHLGGVYRDRGDHVQAAATYQEAIDVLRAVYPDGHPDLAANLHNLGYENWWLISEMEDDAESDRAAEQNEALLREALEMKRRFLGTDHPSLHFTVEILGWFIRAGGPEHHARAEQFFRDEYARATGPEALSSRRGLLAAMLRANGKHAEAEPLALANHRAATASGDAERVERIRQWLVGFYDDWGRAGEAARWRALAPADSTSAP